MWVGRWVVEFVCFMFQIYLFICILMSHIYSMHTHLHSIDIVAKSNEFHPFQFRPLNSTPHQNSYFESCFFFFLFFLSFFNSKFDFTALLPLLYQNRIHMCMCMVRWWQAENKKEESESHAHTNRIEFKNDNIIIRKGAPKYWIDWKTLSSPLLSASATPHMIHTRSTHIGQWCNTRSIIYLSGWCFECSTFIHHKKSFVLSMSICKPSVTTSINIHHQNHHHHCRHHNQSINNNNNNKKEKYNWIVLLAPFKFCAFAFAWRKILFLSFIFQQLMLSHLLLPSLPHGLHFVRTANMKCHLHNPNFSSWTFKSNQIKPNKQHQISPESVNCIKTEWKQNCDANGWLSLRYTIKVEISDYFFPFANFIPYHIV